MLKIKLTPPKVIGIYYLITAFSWLIIPFYFSLKGFTDYIHPFVRFFTESAPQFDADHYWYIATQGYSRPQAAAFYPLWPIFLSLFHKIFGQHGFVISSVLALGFFYFCLLKFSKELRSYFSEAALLFFFAFILINPNAIFYQIGYAEVLYFPACLYLVYINSLRKEDASAWENFRLCVMIGLTRPVFMNFLCAHLATSLFLKVRPAKMIVSQLAGLACGYLVFGLYCLQIYGDFWKPYRVQHMWGREFGWHWDLFFSPKSVSHSDNVLFWDLQGFYLPTLLLGVLLVKRDLLQRLPSKLSYFCVFGLFISASYAGVEFFSHEEFYSLARHVFTAPWFYLGALIFLEPLSKPRAARNVLIVYLIVAGVFVIDWWIRYARHGWMG